MNQSYSFELNFKTKMSDWNEGILLQQIKHESTDLAQF